MLFILFQLGGDRYALPAREVVEVLPMVALKELPGASPGVAGLMDYRGTAVPVVDLSALAVGRPAASRVSTRILMVRYTAPLGTEHLLALLAERATETLRKEPGEFQAVGVRSERTPYLGPVVPDARGLIQRVDLAMLLSAELRAALFPAAEGAAP